MTNEALDSNSLNVKLHRHDGVDNARLNPKDFEGFPIYTAVPTHNALEGTQVIVNDGTVSLYVMVGGTWTQIGATASATEMYAFGNAGATATGTYLKLAGGVQGSSNAGYYIGETKTIVKIIGAWDTDLTSGNVIIRRGGNNVLSKAISDYYMIETGLTTSFTLKATMQVYLDSLSESITDPSIIVFMQ